MTDHTHDDVHRADTTALSPEELARARERFTAPPVFDTSGGNKVDTGGLKQRDEGFMKGASRG